MTLSHPTTDCSYMQHEVGLALFGSSIKLNGTARKEVALAGQSPMRPLASKAHHTMHVRVHAQARGAHVVQGHT